MKTWVRAATEGTCFVIMGDWNRRLALPGDVFWSTIDMKDPPNADLVLADAGVMPRCDPRYRDLSTTSFSTGIPALRSPLSPRRHFPTASFLRIIANIGVASTLTIDEARISGFYIQESKEPLS